MKKYFLIFIISFIFIANSCQKTQGISFEYPFPNQIWNSFKKVHFDTRIKDKKTPRSLLLEIKLTDNFQQQSFDFGMSRTNDEGESRYSNFSIPVKDNQGNLDGEIDDKGLFTYKFLMFKKTYFNSDSLHHFTFESTMNKFDVQGVSSLKLVIEGSE